MTWGSKATANHQVRARWTWNSQENWARWVEKLQTQKNPQQTANPHAQPTGDTAATQSGLPVLVWWAVLSPPELKPGHVCAEGATGAV